MSQSYFTSLVSADFQRLAHAGYLKGLLNPFKGKGELEVWASQCSALRDDLIALAEDESSARPGVTPSICFQSNWPNKSLLQGRPFCAGAT